MVCVAMWCGGFRPTRRGYPIVARQFNPHLRRGGRILKLPPRSAASWRPLRSWKAPPTRSLESLRYVVHAFQRASSGGFPAARWWYFPDAAL